MCAGWSGVAVERVGMAQVRGVADEMKGGVFLKLTAPYAR